MVQSLTKLSTGWKGALGVERPNKFCTLFPGFCAIVHAACNVSAGAGALPACAAIKSELQREVPPTGSLLIQDARMSAIVFTCQDSTLLCVPLVFVPGDAPVVVLARICAMPKALMSPCMLVGLVPTVNDGVAPLPPGADERGVPGVMRINCCNAHTAATVVTSSMKINVLAAFACSVAHEPSAAIRAISGFAEPAT